MAKRTDKASTGKSSAAKSETSSGNGNDPVIEAALGLAAEKGWRDLALADIAVAAGLSMARLYAQYPSKSAILAGYGRAIDSAVLAGVDGDQTGESTKDRLFDLLMRRFDQLEPHKAGLQRIAEDTGRDPLSLICGLASLERSMATMLEAASLSTTGLRGVLRIKGLSALYLAGLRAWFRDDSADKAKTMAALDKALGRAERLASGFGRRSKRDAV